MIRPILTTIAATILLMPYLAHAGQSPTARTTESTWARSDKCNREAIAKYPDHTSEALAKREQQVRHCNLANRTPARAPLSARSNE